MVMFRPFKKEIKKKTKLRMQYEGLLKPVVTMKMVLGGQGWGWWKRKMLMRLEGWHS